MARYDWYILRVWRSGRADGERWAGRLDGMPGGESLRFATPEALLDHLREAIAPAESQSPDARAVSVPHLGKEEGEGIED